MQFKRLKPGDERAAIRAIHDLKPEDERQGNDASSEHMRALLAADSNYLIVAFDGTMPVGFLLAYAFPRVDRDQNMIYLYEIDVRPDDRRRGIGAEMIRLLKRECRDDQVMEIWVGTDVTNTPARRLFEATGAVCEGESYAEYVYRLS